jgi:ankyrin repeat protein
LDVAFASRKREVTRYLAIHMGVMDPCGGEDIDPSDKTPDNPVPSTTLNPVGIAKQTRPRGRLDPSLLHDACAKGSVDDVQLLINQGADVNGRNDDHNTALLVALKDGKLEVAKVLIEYGADANCRDKTGWTPLMIASLQGYRDIAELLLDHGADVNANKEDLWTALHVASLYGYLEIVKVLLDRGADIHARDSDGRTPSLVASKRGERDVVQFLSGMEVKSPMVWILLVHLSVILIPILSLK